MKGQHLADLWQAMGWQWHHDDIYASGLSTDSRSTQAGDLFLALATDAAQLQANLHQAQHQQACAMVIDDQFCQQIDSKSITLPLLRVTNLSQHKAALASQFYGHPSDNMLLIGITGTNGKTSVSHFLAQALNQLQQPCGVIGTIGHGLLTDLQNAINTTPDSPLIQNLLAQMHAQGATACAMEVSSHALDQHRVDGCEFDIAVLTNLSRDHLDYHLTMASYKVAKAKLFARPNLKHAVVNVDDDLGQQLLQQASDKVKFWTYSLVKPITEVSVALLSVNYSEQGIQAQLATIKGPLKLNIGLLGQFNLANIMAVVTSLLALDYTVSAIGKALSGITPVAGRMERFLSHQHGTMVVDYAHTPEALRAALQGIKQHIHTGKLWCVFGCGGDRDQGKRPLMARVAEQLADHVIVTDDNPRYESSAEIISQIRTGFTSPEQVVVIADRASAIAFAWQQAQPEDIILVAGKGHENYQDSAGKRVLFSDRQQVAKLLAEKPTCVSL